MTFIVSHPSLNHPFNNITTTTTKKAWASQVPVPSLPQGRREVQQPITMPHRQAAYPRSNSATAIRASASHCKYILLVCCLLSLIAPVLCSAPQQNVNFSGSLAAQVFTAPRKNPFSPNAISRVRRRNHGGSGGIAPKVEGSFEDVTEAECVALGLEKCGDVCVAQCCSQEAALACPVNSYCTSNNEYDFCCRDGHQCDEPISCLSFDDPQCIDNAGEVVGSGADAKACCYKGFETCTTIWDGFPACMPTGIVEVPPKPTKHFHSKTGSYNPTLEHSATGTETPTKATFSAGMITPAPTLADHQDKKGNESSGNEDNDHDDDDDDDDDEEEEHSYSGVGGIAGGVVGGVIGLGIVGAAVFFISRHYRRKWKEMQRLKEEEDAMSTGGCGSGSGASSPKGNNGSGGGGVVLTKKYWISAEEEENALFRASAPASPFWAAQQQSMSPRDIGYGTRGVGVESKGKGKQPERESVEHVEEVKSPPLHGVTVVAPAEATERQGVDAGTIDNTATTTKTTNTGTSVVASPPLAHFTFPPQAKPSEPPASASPPAVAALRAPSPVHLTPSASLDDEPLPLTPPRSPRIGPIRTITMASMSGAL